MTDSPDNNIAGYRILQRVYSDPRGEIAIATPEQAPRFADKVVLRISPFSALGSEVSVREYMRRAALYATLSHSSIIQAYELSTAQSAVVLVLEFTEGIALDDFRASLDALGVEVPDDVVFYIGLRVLGALTAAHAARDPGDGSHTPVVHGNVRPECILIPWDGYVRLAEFEVARISAVWRGVEAASRPTPSRYMAPEQVNSGLASVKTDVYSVALVMWEMLTKMVAVPQSLSGSSLARAMAKPKFAPLGRVRPDLPTKLLSVMDRALAPAAQRTVTAPEMLAVLRELTATDQAEAKLLQLLERARGAPSPAVRRRGSHPSFPSAQEIKADDPQDVTQVGELELLEETAIDSDALRPPTTPPPLPVARASTSKLAVPPRPRLTPSGGTPAAKLPVPKASPSAGMRAAPPRPASQAGLRAADPIGPVTEPAPPPAATERPDPISDLPPPSQRIPESQRIPRVRESSGRIGLLEWSANSSSEIPAAPPMLEANPPSPFQPAAVAPTPTPPPLLGGHTLPLLTPQQLPSDAPAPMPLPSDAPAALFGGTQAPAPVFLPDVAPKSAPIEVDPINVVPPSEIPPAGRGWSRVGYALLLLVGAGFGVALYFFAEQKLNPPPVAKPLHSAPTASLAVTTTAIVPSTVPLEPSTVASAAAAPSASTPIVAVAPSAPASASAQPAVVDPPVEPIKPPPDDAKTAKVEPTASGSPTDKFGMLDTSGAPHDRRIWVNEKLVGQTGGNVKAPCGFHSVRIGSNGTPHDVMIPCGGTVAVK